MQTATIPQLEVLNGYMLLIVPNDFLDKLERAVDWKLIKANLQRMYPATTGDPPYPPLALFKMSLLQHWYGLSDPQCEELVKDRLSWRRFVGLSSAHPVPDEMTLARFRQRLRQRGQQEKLLVLVNRQLKQRRLISKPSTRQAACKRMASPSGNGWRGRVTD
jgi:IS5 family transposase